MIVEIGHYALILALSLSLVQSALPMIGAKTGDARLMETGTITATGGFVLLALSFASTDICPRDVRFFGPQRL